ncbi:hypothetical protein C8Q76DRAFT_753787 [Earliella scabrosa]|nr:hypothetical protein C8Q76DRAFT_753787 [Earliella scabrosa]
MEVEVSGSEEDVPTVEVAPVQKLPLPDPKTPQRASEVFGFLSRRNTLTVKERDLPPLPQILTPDSTGDTSPLQTDSPGNDNSLGEHLDATPSANTSHSTQHTSSDTNSHASHAQIQTATMTKLSSAFAASTTSLNLLISQGDEVIDNSNTKTAPTSKEVGANHTGSTSSSTARAASHHTGSSLSSSNSTKVPPSKIPRGPRPRPQSICVRDAQEAPEADTPQSDAPALTHQRKTSADHARRSKREAFTHIPQRQHKRITSRSSAREDDDDAVVKPSAPSSKPPAHARKRSTKPEPLALGKENTPSPPPAPRRSEYECAYEPTLGLGITTPARHRLLIEPPSPASSSELSPVAREMMNDLRQQRMRVRHLERRQGLWTRS